MSIFVLICGWTRVRTLQSTFIKYADFFKPPYENSKVIDNVGDMFDNANPGPGGPDGADGGDGGHGGNGL